MLLHAHIASCCAQEMQTLAYRLILGQLVSAGLLIGSLDELLDKEIGALFSKCRA